MKRGREYAHLVFDTTSLHLIAEDLGTGLLSFGFVDVFHEDSLVLEHITLGALIEFVVPGDSQSASKPAPVTLTHKCLSIFPASLYFLNNLLSTL
jgi:hypothetical protein